MFIQDTATPASDQNRGRIIGRGQKLRRIYSSLVRHLVMRNSRPYEQLLRYVRGRGDIWITSQGEYMSWWQKRVGADLMIYVSDGICYAKTSLEGAVIEKFPGEFLGFPMAEVQETSFSGEVWITIESSIDQKELLIELLKTEGILNFRIAPAGEFLIRREDVESLLEEIEAKWQQRDILRATDLSAIRQIVIDKLAAQKLPLLRIWYHPQIDGMIPRAVFSPRYDVDRAITNLAHIRALEKKYRASSTLYIRAFCPFYTDKEIQKLASKSWCSEIALHGEFVTNSRTYGNEFKAAEAEKIHLNRLIGREVRGVCMHGGELAYNRSENTAVAIQKVDFLYDTTPTFFYYLPFRRFVKGHLSKSYTLCHALSDVRLPANRNYCQVFYEQARDTMDKIYEQNGVFVILQHPIYFGLFAYLALPKNLFRVIVYFLAERFKHSWR